MAEARDRGHHDDREGAGGFQVPNRIWRAGPVAAGLHWLTFRRQNAPGQGQMQSHFGSRTISLDDPACVSQHLCSS